MTSPPSASRSQAGSARHGVLQRLAPVLKHDMVVHLQAIAMLADVLTARLDKAALSPAEVEAGIGRLHRLTRDAVQTCLHVATWIAPPRDDTIRLRTGVDEVVALLRTGLSFRGLSLAVEVPDTDVEVAHAALRFLLPAALLDVADSLDGAGSLRLTVQLGPSRAELTVQGGPPADDNRAAGPAAPPPTLEAGLDWAEVEALAASEHATLQRSPGRITLGLPRLRASGPVQIAPV